MQQTLSVIDLNAIRSNALYLKSRLDGKKLYAVVKADAYGHGAVKVSLAIQDIADGFCVALVQEGAALRIAGITKPILVFTPPLDREDAETALFYNLTVTVNGTEAANLSRGLDCFIKVNTGMNRYGCNVDCLQRLLGSLDGVNVMGVYSHLYAPQDRERSFKQLKLFDTAEREVKLRYPKATAFLAASGGFFLGGEFLKDGVRAGISLYGYSPEGFVCSKLKPALKVYARLAQKTEFIGGGIGYNVAERDYGTLYTYRLGYADGFSRSVPLGEGNLCMDGFISETGGKWVNVLSDAGAYAKKCRTISYEVLCSVTRRSRRIYI